MTREEAKEWLPLIQAWAEGKSIQYQTDSGSWSDITKDLYTDNHSSKYRVKPEPKYRPFQSQEECWNEMLKHQPLGWIRSIDTQCLRNIGFIGRTTYGIGINNSIMYFDTAFNAYNFADGTPFGIKEEYSIKK